MGNSVFSSSPTREASASVREQGNSSSESEERGVVFMAEREGISVVLGTLQGISSGSDL